MAQFTPKKQSEEKVYTFNMSSRLDSGETMISVVFSVSVSSGLDSAPQNMISGNPSISGTRVSQKIIGGVAGVIYVIIATIITSTGRKLIPNAYLQVISDSQVT